MAQDYRGDTVATVMEFGNLYIVVKSWTDCEQKSTVYFDLY